MKKFFIGVTLIFSAPFILKAEPVVYEFLCEERCTDIINSVDNMVNQMNASVLEDELFMNIEPFSSDDIFVQYDSGVAVNSITYQDYLAQKTNTYSQFIDLNFGSKTSQSSSNNFTPVARDGALSCEYDRDYDCEAWGDYSGIYKPYIVAIQNQVYNFEWGYTITQDDIDAINLTSKIRYDFAIGVLVASPASRLAKIVSKGLNKTIDDMNANLIGAGVSAVVVGQLFTGARKTSLKVGDIVMFKGGKLVSVARDGIIYNASSIMGPIDNLGAGDSGGSSGEGYAEGSVLRGGGVVRIPRISYCYRTFSNGQVIQVPCP